MVLASLFEQFINMSYDSNYVPIHIIIAHEVSVVVAEWLRRWT